MTIAAGHRAVSHDEAPFREPEAEQLTLFNMGVDVSKLVEKRKLIVLTHERAANTRRGYASDWADFTAWCRDAGRSALPATDETVALYLTHLSDRLMPATLDRRSTAIAEQHKRAGLASPIGQAAREVRRAVRRSCRRKSNVKAALTVDELLAMVRAIAGEHEPWATRNRALLLVGFASGMRRGELCGLDRESAEMRGSTKIALHIGRSKTDQEGRGRVVGLFSAKRAALCPVRALRAWLKVRGREPGPLFLPILPGGRIEHRRLSDDMVYEVVKSAAEAAGLDPARFGAHSLRAGLVTASLDAGYGESVVASRTGHKSVAVLARYYRRRSAFAVDPLRGVL